MKKTLILTCIAASMNLFAGEPFLLKNDKGNEFLKTKPELFSKKKSQANASGATNTAVKLNLTQLGFKNISLQGEYGFHRKMSVALGISYLIQRPFPGVLYDTDDNQYSEHFSTPTYGGFAITPEFRFYPGGQEDKPAPNGFYIAVYLRYAKYNLKQTVSYQETPNSTRYSAEAKQTYGGFNGGLMIGRQWIIGKHFSLDWWIIGGGYGTAKYTYSWKAPAANLNQKQQDDVKKQAEENFSSFSAFGFESSVETTHNSATMTVKGLPMMSIRFMGLCVGYAF